MPVLCIGPYAYVVRINVEEIERNCVPRMIGLLETHLLEAEMCLPDLMSGIYRALTRADYRFQGDLSSLFTTSRRLSPYMLSYLESMSRQAGLPVRINEPE
jgi:hypothetical protein